MYTPVNLYYSPSVPEWAKPEIAAAAQVWEQAIGKLVFKLSNLDISQPKQDGVSVIYWKSEWPEELSVEQAFTTVYWESNQIFEADIQVNAKDFVFSDSPDESEIDLESVMIHELGHVLGLEHNTPGMSVMEPVLFSGEIRRQLYSIDYEDIQCEYKL
jgi:hypothetical protein